jgi:AraC-like DNA-binding protein
MFYQSENSLRSDLIKVETGRDFSFPTHLHGSFELVTVTEGVLTVTVDKMQYALTPGKALLIFPNQPHSFYTEAHSHHLVCIFSPQLIRAFGGTFRHKFPESNLFLPDGFYLQKLAELRTQQAGILEVKGLLYSLCALFDKTAVYRERENTKADLLMRIFAFVEEHFNRDCSLEALSAETAYHGVYLSRYFKQCTGLSFTDHVNRYRINEAMYLLKNTPKKVLDIAYDCGFDSLRSFNRNFKKIVGMTPVGYRNT